MKRAASVLSWIWVFPVAFFLCGSGCDGGGEGGGGAPPPPAAAPPPPVGGKPAAPLPPATPDKPAAPGDKTSNGGPADPPPDSTNLVASAAGDLTQAANSLSQGAQDIGGLTDTGASGGGDGGYGSAGGIVPGAVGNVQGRYAGEGQTLLASARMSDTSSVKKAANDLEDLLRATQPSAAPTDGNQDPGSGSAGPAPGAGRAAAQAAADQIKFHDALKGAITKAKMGDWRGALEDLNTILRMDPNNVAALAKRAETLNHLKLYAEAEKDARRAIELDPNNPKAWEQLANSLFKQKRYKEALEAINRAIQLSPDNARLWKMRAMIKDALGDHAGAIQDMEKAALLDPRYRSDLDLMKAGGKLVDDDDDDEAAGIHSHVRMPKWPAAAALGALLLLTLVAGLNYRRRPEGASTAKQGAMIAERPAAPAFAPESGGRMLGKYELGRVIGHGGMGEVYEARDLSLGRTVAVKKMSTQLSELGTQGRQLLLKEARMVASLHHPAIVDIYEIIEQGDDLYLVFEFVTGKTAHQMLAEKGRFTPAEALELLRPVCQALSFAHSQSMVHRDLKPANIMVTAQGHVKLMDFGVARSLAEGAQIPQPGPAPAAGNPLLARTQTIVGTPSYMSPETGEGVVCKEADVYSLGVTLYELLTGRLPFGVDASVMDKLAMKCPAPSQLVSGLPRAVDELVGRALQPRVEHRTKTPAEFLAGLEAAVGVKAAV